MACARRWSAAGAGATTGNDPLRYTTTQASRLTGCSVSQVRYWASTGLVTPASGGGDEDPGGGYAFADLVALRVVRSLLDSGLTLQRIRRACAFLREAGDDLAGLRLVTDGSTVLACRSDGEVLDALRGGQLALFVGVGDVAAELEPEVARFDRERAAFVDELRRDFTG